MRRRGTGGAGCVPSIVMSSQSLFYKTFSVLCSFQEDIIRQFVVCAQESGVVESYLPAVWNTVLLLEDALIVWDTVFAENEASRVNELASIRIQCSDEGSRRSKALSFHAPSSALR